jgi:two-component system CheB/CheR fusion protein
VTPTDEGRPISDFAHQLEYDDLLKDARAVLADLTPVRREIRTRKGQWYDMRIRPYRTLDDKIDGVVITFLDITERLHAAQALRESEQSLRRQKILLELARDPIFIWDFDDGVLEWNRGCEVLYGYSASEAVGKNLGELLNTAVSGSSLDKMRGTLLRDKTWTGELVQTSKSGRKIRVQSRLHLETIDGRRFVLETEHEVAEKA